MILIHDTTSTNTLVVDDAYYMYNDPNGDLVLAFTDGSEATVQNYRIDDFAVLLSRGGFVRGIYKKWWWGRAATNAIATPAVPDDPQIATPPKDDQQFDLTASF